MSMTGSGRRASIAVFRTALLTAFAVAITGCTMTRLPEPPPLDLSPVACGHKWIQSAHSARTRHICGDDTAELLARLEPATTDKLWARPVFAVRRNVSRSRSMTRSTTIAPSSRTAKTTGSTCA